MRRSFIAHMKLLILVVTLAVSGPAFSQVFDHAHAEWTALLKKHVVWVNGEAAGVTSVVDYAGFKRDRAALDAYTGKLAAIKPAEYARWTLAQKQAFLINAYNAYTVALIVGSYPNVKSIKDLGSVISSPWSKRLYPLLGEKRSLDDIEHKMLRGAKDFKEPRIHFAVNCASIGCPALRHEAFRATQLAEQLEDQTRRFLRDRSRNRFDRKADVLHVSSIFDWYQGDFEKGYLGAKDLEGFLALYAGSLGLAETDKQRLKSGEIDIEFTDYDWTLNRKR